MTLVRTDTGVVALISKIAADDEEGAAQLLRLGIYEAMCSLADADAAEHEAGVRNLVLKRSDEGRRALVRSFIDRRIAGEDIDDVLTAAEYMTTVELVAKNKKDRQGNLHDRLGRFTSGANNGANILGAFGGDRNRSQQMAALGTALTTNGSAVGQAVSAAGALGTEAERVLGPGLQRAAYRFRGTERRPSNALHNAINDHQEPLGAREQMYRQQGFTPDQRRLAIRGDAVAAYFASQLPKPKDAELSYASGRVPPSRGAIIDADGDVITEAVGLNGDHYVPFDLKNLGRMEGGQYVRTRAAGGPTREDLYAGLMGGARQVQVVSHSGVFTLELDPDLRGGRRYSDKARQMTNRYQEILETINQERVAAVPLDNATMNRLRQRALAQSGGDVKDARTKLADLTHEEMQRQAFERDREEEDAAVKEAVQHRVAAEERKAGGFSNQERARIARDIEPEVRAQLSEETPRSLKLDGEGYARALDALQGEFPYFIRDVRHEPLREFGEQMGLRNVVQSLPAKGPKDRGFVRGDQNVAALRGANDRRVTSAQMSPRGASGTGDAPRARDEAKPDEQKAPATGATVAAPKDSLVPDFSPREIDPRSPMLGDVLKTSAGAQVLDEAADSLNDVLVTAEAVKDSKKVVPDIAKWGEDDLKGKAPEFVLSWLADESKTDGDPMGFLFDKAKPETREAVREAMTKVPAMAKDLEDPDYAAKVLTGAQHMTEVLDLADPFGATPSKETLFTTPKTTDKPLAFGQIKNLRSDSAAFKAWEERAAASDDDMRDFLESANPALIQKTLRVRAELKDAAARGDRELDGMDVESGMKLIEEQIPKMHLAYAFQQTRERVAAWHARAGKGDAAPFEGAAASTLTKRGSGFLSSVQRPYRVSSVRKSDPQREAFEAALAEAWRVGYATQ